MNNIRSGVVSLATPPIKFGVDTIPSLISHGIHTAADKVMRLGEANSEAVGKVALGVSESVGAGGVLGSSVAQGAMHVVGGALGAGTDIAHAVAQAGVRLAGQVADSTAAGAVATGNMTGATLSTIGQGLEAAAGGVTLLSSGLSTALDNLSEHVVHNIHSLEQTISNLIKPNTTQSNAHSSVPNNNLIGVLNAIFHILLKIQNIFSRFSGILS